MNYCLICGNELKGCICPRCGFDLSCCGEDYPTLGPESPVKLALRTRRNAYYQELNQKILSLMKRVEELEKNPAVNRQSKTVIRQLEPSAFVQKWECECGYRNPAIFRYCKSCNRAKPLIFGKDNGGNVVKPSVSEDTAICKDIRKETCEKPKRIILFITSTSPRCVLAKKFLYDAGITFETAVIDKDPELEKNMMFI